MSLALVGLVGFGPALLAERRIAAQRDTVQAGDVAARPFAGEARVVDMYDQPCAETCAALLATGRIEAVRIVNQYDVKEVFSAGADGQPQRAEDLFPPGDLTLAALGASGGTLRDDWGIGDAGFAKVEIGSRLTITEGPVAARESAAILFRKSDVSHSVPLMLTMFRGPLTGWTGSGNDGGVVIERTKRWRFVEPKAEWPDALAGIGLDLAPASGARD